MRKEIAQLSEQYNAIFEECANQIWSTPELNFTEHKSHEAAKKCMEDLGFEVSMLPDMDTAFIATAGHGSPVIGILGELDALPGLRIINERLLKSARIDSALYVKHPPSHLYVTQESGRLEPVVILTATHQ